MWKAENEITKKRRKGVWCGSLITFARSAMWAPSSWSAIALCPWFDLDHRLPSLHGWRCASNWLVSLLFPVSFSSLAQLELVMVHFFSLNFPNCPSYRHLCVSSCPWCIQCWSKESVMTSPTGDTDSLHLMSQHNFPPVSWCCYLQFTAFPHERLYKCLTADLTVSNNPYMCDMGVTTTSVGS